MRLRSVPVLAAFVLSGVAGAQQPAAPAAAIPAPPPATAPAPPAARRPLSPRGTASAQVLGKWEKQGEESRYVGGKWIDVDYSRPMLRGRANVFGSGAEYGKAVNAGAPVWRVGANATTKLTTEVPLTIGGKKIEPGTYAMFVELKEGAWTLIVSTQKMQEKYDPKDKTAIWGSYGYDPKFDVVRAPMHMVKLPHAVDQLTIGFLDVTDAGGELAIAWDKDLAVTHFTVTQ